MVRTIRPNTVVDGAKLTQGSLDGYFIDLDGLGDSMGGVCCLVKRLYCSLLYHFLFAIYIADASLEHKPSRQLQSWSLLEVVRRCSEGESTGAAYCWQADPAQIIASGPG